MAYLNSALPSKRWVPRGSGCIILEIKGSKEVTRVPMTGPLNAHRQQTKRPTTEDCHHRSPQQEGQGWECLALSAAGRQGQRPLPLPTLTNLVCSSSAALMIAQMAPSSPLFTHRYKGEKTCSQHRFHPGAEWHISLISGSLGFYGRNCLACWVFHFQGSIS